MFSATFRATCRLPIHRLRVSQVNDIAEKLLETRSQIYRGPKEYSVKKSAEEGGCGVTGFACTNPLAGRFIYEPSIQMQNRGNGKGGGIAAVGFPPEQMGVS